jgi:DNA-binding transcriptional LysR family regulator
LAREGSLSGAARVLQTTQPTMGRRLDAFEVKLGAQLFRRTSSGLVLTEAGDAVLGHAKRMEDAAVAAERVVMGRDSGLRGTVRVTSPEWYGSRVLSTLLSGFCIRHPEITIELVTDALPLNLARREVDLAIRFRRFDQDGLLQRKVGETPFGLYAAPAYLARKGDPDFEQAGLGTDLVVMSETLSGMVAETEWIRERLGSARVAFRSNSRDAQAAAAAAGVGLACLASDLGDGWPGLVRLTAPEPVPTREVWLGMHRDMRAVPRVRALADFLADGLRRPASDPAAADRTS